jgi:hypothetical protein
MTTHSIGLKLFILLMTAIISASAAPLVRAEAQSAAPSEDDAPLLTETALADVVKQENCIVMYYNDARHFAEETAENAYAASPAQTVNALLDGLKAFRKKTGSTVKLYLVRWNGFSMASLDRIRADTGSASAYPDNPSIVAYRGKSGISLKVRSGVRPDTASWLINELMKDFLPTIQMENGSYLYAGWVFTDTNAKHINMSEDRKDTVDFNGKKRDVRIITFASKPADGFSCAYERIYSTKGALLGSIETYGPFGKVGYFDYNETGKMQYRVKYGAAAAPAAPAPPASRQTTTQQ